MFSFLTMMDNVEVHFFGEFLLLVEDFLSLAMDLWAVAYVSLQALTGIAKLFHKEIAPVPITTSCIFQQAFPCGASTLKAENRNISQGKKMALRIHLVISGTYRRLFTFQSEGVSPV